MGAERLLSEIVGINSIFPNESRLAAFVERRLKRMGFRVRRDYLTRSRYNLLAERGKGKGSILFYCHLDTVPDYGDWHTNPFRLTAKGDQLYGLGTCDMKGGTAAALCAIDEARGKRIKMLFCVDEENISEGAWHAVTHNKEWFKDVKFAVSCEPGDSRRHTGGSNVITIGRRGRVVISIDIEGLASHGAQPQRGVNAINEASTIVKHLGMFRLLKHGRLGPETIFVRKLESSSTSLSVPDKAHLELDMHLVPPSTRKDAESRAKEFIEMLFRNKHLDSRTKIKVGIKERKTPYIEPYVNHRNNGHIKRIFGIVADDYGKAIPNYGSSVADDNILSTELHVPIVTIGPTGGNEHSENEWVSRKSLKQLVGTYSRIIEEC
ncbi:MAG: M20/M25/M40 family metallo-hydrolase [Candidatus Micrarchaeota archaeon]|nr:M20/M25/M40 family metallo-hydrolase [Candidatus Micrarchaeota archaeon]